MSTNFLVKYAPPDSLLDRCWRYSTAYLALQAQNGLITNQIAMSILSTIYNYTQRSAVYNQTTGKVILCVGGKYGQIHKLRLPMVVDLAVIKTKVSRTHVNVGGHISLTARIVNRSPRLSKATKVKFYLTKKRKLNDQAILIGSSKLQSLAYKEKKTLRLSVDLSEQITAGRYFLIGYVDEKRRNHDPIPENNMAAIKIQLQ